MTDIEKNAVTGNVIEARDLSLSFGNTPALRGASLAVRRGEIVAVMGPSGSGKSTLLHCLAGILIPGEGEVWFDGQRVEPLPAEPDLALIGHQDAREAVQQGGLA